MGGPGISGTRMRHMYRLQDCLVMHTCSTAPCMVAFKVDVLRPLIMSMNKLTLADYYHLEGGKDSESKVANHPSLPRNMAFVAPSDVDK